MEPSAFLSEPRIPGHRSHPGAGPAGLVLAISLARRGLSATVIERDVPPDIAPRLNPDRSYTIDISGHGLKALRHIEAVAEFDRRIFRFKGLKIPGRGTEEWTLPGWTGSRGDILRALMSVLDQHKDRVSMEFETTVEGVDPVTGSVKSRQRSGNRTSGRSACSLGPTGPDPQFGRRFKPAFPGLRSPPSPFPTTAR